MGGDLASQPTPDIEVPELTPIGESVIIKENGKFRKYNVFQAKEQDEDSIIPPAEVKEQPPIAHVTIAVVSRHRIELRDERYVLRPRRNRQESDSECDPQGNPHTGEVHFRL